MYRWVQYQGILIITLRKQKSAKRSREAIDKLGYIPNLMVKPGKGVSNSLLLYILQEKPIVESTWLYELPIIQSIYDYIKATNTPCSWPWITWKTCRK